MDNMDFSLTEHVGNFNLHFPERGESEVVDFKPSTNEMKSDRSVAPLSENDVKYLIESQENGNTKKNTAWAFRVF